MKDSIFNVKSSGLGGITKDISRTAKLAKKVHKERQARKQKESSTKEKEAKKYLAKKQKSLEKVYRKRLSGNKTKPRTTSFKIKRPYVRSVKGTVHSDMKNYKVPKYNKWGDRIN